MHESGQGRGLPRMVLAGTALISAGGLAGALFLGVFYGWPGWFDLGTRPMEAYGPASASIAALWVGGILVLWGAIIGPARRRLAGVALAILALALGFIVWFAVFQMPTMWFMGR